MTEINGVGQQGVQQHTLPKKGMKMSDLAKTNKLLFDYFKNNGFKDDEIVLESHIKNLKAQIDADKSGDISVKEAREMGINGSRKDVKAAIGMLDTIANTELDKDAEIPEEVDDKNTNYYQNGVLKKSVYNDGKREQVKEFEKDGKTPKETRTTVLEGDKVVYSDRTVYYQGNKNYTEMDNDILHSFTLYTPNTNKPQRSVVTLKNDKGELDNNSTKTTLYSNYGEGQAHIETITYTGEMIEDGVTERVIEYDKDGKEIKNTTNKGDEPVAKEEKVSDAKVSEKTEEKADKKDVNTNTQKTRPAFTPPKQKVHLPKEWSKKPLPDGAAEELKLSETYTADEVLDKLAEKFGIKKEEIQADKLKADLIKYNPSVFDKDGNVFEGAKFAEKLDFPQNAGELYKKGAEAPKVTRKRNNPPTPPKKDKWHVPLMTPEQQAEADKVRAEAKAKKERADGFEKALNGDLQITKSEREEIKVPLNTPSMQKKADAERAAKKAEEEAAKGFEEGLKNGRVPKTPQKEIPKGSIPLMTPDQQKIADNARAEQQARLERAKQFEENLHKYDKL